MPLFVTVATAQIAGLCNTGQTSATLTGCTGVLVPSAPNFFGTPNLDGNWEIAYPYPSSLADNTPCLLSRFIEATVDTPNGSWLPNSVSSASESTMPDGGGGYMLPLGWYVYRTKFPIPSVLPGGGVPKGVTNCQLAWDNAAYRSSWRVQPTRTPERHVIYHGSSTGLRAEFFDTSAFN
jgi:hypothetical protein